MLTDNLTDAVWQTHAGGTADIGGVAYTDASMTALPFGDIVLQVSGSADPTGKGYPCQMWYTTRPIYSKTACKLVVPFCLGPTALTAMNAIELDCMYAILCADGKTRLFNGSAQWLPGTGWMVVNAAGEWVATGYNPAYNPDKKYRVRFVHSWDLVKNTMSVVSIDGYQVPSALQNVLAAITTWAAGFVNFQAQPSGKPAGLAWMLTIGRKLRLKWA